MIKSKIIVFILILLITAVVFITFVKKNDSILWVSCLFRDEFPHEAKLNRTDQHEIVNKIVKYVLKYAHSSESDNKEIIAERLDEAALDGVFSHIHIDDRFTTGFWKASQGAWYPLPLFDVGVIDEVHRRVKEKNDNFKGYVKDDPCQEYWLLIHIAGESISDINLVDGFTPECKVRLDEIARQSPFTKIYICDPYWAVKYLAIK